MNMNNVEFRVLIKDKAITEYRHNGNTFVEGREGSSFEIEFINRNPYRVEAIITVDGLSVIDGKLGSPESSGYLVDAGERIVIPGWKINDGVAAKFVFSGKGQSYSTITTGSAANNGVIGCMVYAERYRRPVTKVASAPPFRGIVPQQNMFLAGGFVPTSTSSRTFGMADQTAYTSWSGDLGVSQGGSAMACAASASTSAAAASASATTASTQAAYATQDAFYTSNGNKGVGASNPRAVMPVTLENTRPEPLNNLGTGFGEATTFETQVASFNRGDLLGIIVLYYDNARGLKARGIQIGRPSRVKFNREPQAFPGMQVGCAPPPGWKG